MKAFGLDLAGYSTGASALAIAERESEKITVTLLVKNPFAQRADGNSGLQEVTIREIECLGTLLGHAPLYVDVPIDLQDLLSPSKARFLWQLTKRPVDRAFEGLCPLADRIGSYVARMQNLRFQLRNRGKDPLGTELYETYPAGSLGFCGLSSEGYKGDCEFRADGDSAAWRPRDLESKQDKALAELISSLNWTTSEDFKLDHDGFDAVLCSLTGVSEQLGGEELNREINKKLRGNAQYTAPDGYVLLKKMPIKVQLEMRNYEEWRKENS